MAQYTQATSTGKTFLDERRRRSEHTGLADVDGRGLQLAREGEHSLPRVRGSVEDRLIHLGSRHGSPRVMGVVPPSTPASGTPRIAAGQSPCGDGRGASVDPKMGVVAGGRDQVGSAAWRDFPIER
jgi:hypothetical protein